MVKTPHEQLVPKTTWKRPIRAIVCVTTSCNEPSLSATIQLRGCAKMNRGSEKGGLGVFSFHQREWSLNFWIILGGILTFSHPIFNLPL